MGFTPNGVSLWTLTLKRGIMPPMAQPVWLTLREVSQRLGVTENNLRQWRFVGKGPKSHKFGAAVMYRRIDIEKWEASQREAVEPA